MSRIAHFFGGVVDGIADFRAQIAYGLLLWRQGVCCLWSVGLRLLSWRLLGVQVIGIIPFVVHLIIFLPGTVVLLPLVRCGLRGAVGRLGSLVDGCSSGVSRRCIVQAMAL